MKQLATLLALAALTLIPAGCGKKPIVASTPSNQPALVVNARDTIAAASGFVANAQQQYGAACKADPQAGKCQYINQAIQGINATITAEEAYCGWNAAAASMQIPPPCQPVASAASGLTVAIGNLNRFVTELKGALGQ